LFFTLDLPCLHRLPAMPLQVKTHPKAWDCCQLPCFFLACTPLVRLRHLTIFEVPRQTPLARCLTIFEVPRQTPLMRCLAISEARPLSVLVLTLIVIADFSLFVLLLNTKFTTRDSIARCCSAWVSPSRCSCSCFGHCCSWVFLHHLHSWTFPTSRSTF